MNTQLSLQITSSRDPNTVQAPPEREQRVICGKTIAAWDHAVVYVHDKQQPYELPTHLYFSFVGFGSCLTTEVCRLVDQWTFYRGHCHRTYRENEHECKRGRVMAIQVVETYRRTYLKRHGQAPNPLLLAGTLNPDLARKRTDKIIRQKQADPFLQQTIHFADEY